MAQLNPLRPITLRLNSTPNEDLPRYAGFLASSIISCSDHLKNLEATRNDGSVQVHKLITRVSSLLQDRSQEARFTGVVLVKALIEVVEPSTLAASGPIWVRSLISCLNKQDPPQVKKMAVVTITRLLLLTKHDQAMVRETTTPSIPAFTTACLNAIKPAIVSTEGVERHVLSTLLQPVLQCWVQLLKVFPSTFRPFVSSIRVIILSLISSQTVSQDVKQIASQVFAILHFCAPKDTTSSEWGHAAKQTIEAIHQTADLIFRAVIEEWSSINSRQVAIPAGKRAKNEVHLEDVDAVGMDKWTGLYAGCVRIIDLLYLLSTLLASQHASVVIIPIAEIFDLITRLTAMLRPTKDYSLRENREITRDEREELFANLPRIYTAALQLNEHLVKSYGRICMPAARQTLSQIWDIIDSASIEDHVRTSVYSSVSQLLQRRMTLLTKKETERLGELVRLCCADLTSGITVHTTSASKGKVNNDLLSTPNKNQYSNTDVVSILPRTTLSISAWNLLPVILTHVPSQLLTSSIRAEIDRTAILVGHQEAMLASILNPPLSRKSSQLTPSIFPFLARSADGGLSIEALMRPRMPVIRNEDHPVDVSISEEHDESRSQPGTDNEDTNPQTVHDHIEQQIENDTVFTEVGAAHLPKKRDFTAAEDVLAVMPEEHSKRPKIVDSPEVVKVSHKLSEDQLQDEIVAMETATTVLTTNSGEVSPFIQPVEITPSETLVTSKPTILVPRDADQNDDSDGSEIPMIDATLSSDEDEDEDGG